MIARRLLVAAAVIDICCALGDTLSIGGFGVGDFFLCLGAFVFGLVALFSWWADRPFPAVVPARESEAPAPH